jgi:putative ABC transport system substrate-binding protein
MNPPNILVEQAAAHRDPYDKELDGAAAQQERSTAPDNPGRVHSRRARPRHSMSSRTLFGFILLLAIAAASSPIDAQQASRIPKVGFLGTSAQAVAPNIAAFRLGLRELGYIEEKTVLLEVRLFEGAAERLSQLARELVALKSDVIVATNDVAIASVRRETQTIPIVMVFSSDPAGAGFVASLARPGGNVTGLSNLSPEISGKRLELLREVVPGLSRVALLWNPDSRGNLLDYKETEAAARSLHVELQSVELSRVEDLDRAFSAVTKGRAEALIVSLGNPITVSRQDQVASFAQRSRLPSIYGAREYVDSGGLMSYGPSVADLFRRAAIYVDRILKGAKPADLPVEQPTKFELVINLKTAKAIGLTMPPSLLRRADHVIQ